MGPLKNSLLRSLELASSHPSTHCVPTTSHTATVPFSVRREGKLLVSHLGYARRTGFSLTHTPLARRQCWYRSTVFLVCCSKYVQHAALLCQVNMCTGEDEAWAHRKQSNGNQKDFLFQSSLALFVEVIQ